MRSLQPAEPFACPANVNRGWLCGGPVETIRLHKFTGESLANVGQRGACCREWLSRGINFSQGANRNDNEIPMAVGLDQKLTMAAAEDAKDRASFSTQSR